jgi:DNA-binding GntR family transcriptional regulator
VTSQRWTSDSTPYLTPGTNDVWADEAKAAGRVGTQRILDAGTVAAPRDVAAAFGIAVGGPVIRRRRLILADDQPVEIAASYYPLHIAGGTALAGADRIRGGAVTLLADLGHRPADIHEVVTARHLTAEEAAILRVPATQPTLVLSRLTLDTTGNPVEFGVMVMSDGQRLEYRMRVTQ